MTDAAPPRRQPPTFYPVEVVSVRDLTSHLRRVTLGGDGLRTYQNAGPCTHLKLLLPGPGETEVAPPTPDREGPRPLSRTYTPRRVDAEGGRVDVDFALHADAGPATSWAASAKVGDRVVITGGRGPYQIDPASPWTVLVADTSALPAASTVLEAAPAGARVLLIAEIDDGADALALASAADLRVTWTVGAEAEPGEAAFRALREAELPAGEGAYWICVEASAMRRIRRFLLEERAVGRERLYTRGYWKIGASNHPDHDTGEEA